MWKLMRMRMMHICDMINGNESMSHMLFERNWQRKSSNSFVLYCFHRRWISVTGYSILKGFNQNVAYLSCQEVVVKYQIWKYLTWDSFPMFMSHMASFKLFFISIIHFHFNSWWALLKWDGHCLHYCFVTWMRRLFFKRTWKTNH